MTRPIEATPVLYGEDAERLIESLEHVAPPEEIERRMRAHRAFRERVSGRPLCEHAVSRFAVCTECNDRVAIIERVSEPWSADAAKPWTIAYREADPNAPAEYVVVPFRTFHRPAPKGTWRDE